MAALNWYIFQKKSGRLSSMGSEILAFGSHCAEHFLPILHCFIPKFKFKYDDLENIKTDRVNTVVFNLLQIKQSNKHLFYETAWSILFWSHKNDVTSLVKFWKENMSRSYCNIYQYSVIITVDTENATINARSMKLCL